MSFSPAFQFYPNDWLGSSKVMMMSPTEEGAYIRLLAISWGEDDCGIPSDDESLSVLSRLGADWKSAKPKIMRCFIEKDGRLFNRRLLAERLKQTDKRKKASASASKRWETDAMAMRTHSDGNANAMRSVCSSIEDEIEIEESICIPSSSLSLKDSTTLSRDPAPLAPVGESGEDAAHSTERIASPSSASGASCSEVTDQRPIAPPEMIQPPRASNGVTAMHARYAHPEAKAIIDEILNTHLCRSKMTASNALWALVLDGFDIHAVAYGLSEHRASRMGTGIQPLRIESFIEVRGWETDWAAEAGKLKGYEKINPNAPKELPADWEPSF